MCLVPVEDWPLLRLIRERAGVPAPSMDAARVLTEVRTIVASSPDGVTISDIERPGSGAKGWDWSDRKHATEHMLRTGELVCTARRGTRRVYDLPERRIPGYLLSSDVSDEEILAHLAVRGLTAMGLATTSDIAKYYNISAEHARRGLDDFQFIGRVDLRREDSHLTVLGAHAESATEANRFEVSLDKTLERLTRQITK
jgi:uncharacterized protein YcaQ